MMKKIVGTFHLFDLHQSIFLIDEEKQSHIAICNLQDMAKNIADLCHVHQVNQVHLYGTSEVAKEIADDIRANSGLKYSNNNIEVEIN